VKLDPRPIFILRRGYSFREFSAEETGKAMGRSLDGDMEKVAGFIEREAANGRRHTGNTVSLEHLAVGLPRQRVRDLIDAGIEAGRFVVKSHGRREFLATSEGESVDLQTP
jgi:hypothetical protein